jgi:hypothetical protein
MMDLPRELAFERLSVEQKFAKAVPGYMRRIRSLYEAIYRRFGNDGLDVIRQVSREYGTAIGTNINKKGGLKGVAGVGGYLLKVFDVVSDDWEITEYSDERMVIAVHRCPYPFEHDWICRAHTSMEQALVATLDPSLEYHIGRSIPQGDAFCEHILARRRTPSSDPTAESDAV